MADETETRSGPVTFFSVFGAIKAGLDLPKAVQDWAALSPANAQSLAFVVGELQGHPTSHDLLDRLIDEVNATAGTQTRQA